MPKIAGSLVAIWYILHVFNTMSSYIASSLATDTDTDRK